MPTDVYFQHAPARSVPSLQWEFQEQSSLQKMGLHGLLKLLGQQKSSEESPMEAVMIQNLWQWAVKGPFSIHRMDTVHLGLQGLQVQHLVSMELLTEAVLLSQWVTREPFSLQQME